MSEVLSFSSGREDRARVRDVVVQSMADDPVAKYLAKEGRLAPFYDGLMSPYWSSKPRDLHLMTKGCKAVVFARFHPQEEVSGFPTLLRDLRLVPSTKLPKAIAAIKLGAKIDGGKAAFGKEHGAYIYIYIIGTLPEHQNKGLGSVLMKHIHAIADSKSLPCYLESSSEGSRRFYERNGYRIRETYYVEKGSPPLYIMSRPASLLKPAYLKQSARLSAQL